MNALQEKRNILREKDFLSLSDVSSDQLHKLLDLAVKLKSDQLSGAGEPLLKGKTLGMIFEKSSTRTRVSFEVGMLQLGGHSLFLSSKDIQIGRGETIADTAKVLSQYVDGIMIRTFEHEKVEELAANATIPVINGLTDLSHPCQALADLLTIKEHKGTLKGLKLAYIGDGNNVAHSLIEACSIVGMHISIGCPKGYMPDSIITEAAIEKGKESGAVVEVCHDPKKAVQDADIIYCDVWTSMGQEQENQTRLNDFAAFQVNEELIKEAAPNYLFMHCLPAHREEEVTAGVIDGPNSVVFDQAGNRLHAQKALLVDLLG